MQYFATQELQMQTPHSTQGREATPHLLAQQKETDTSRPLHTTSFAPRFHPMGGSFNPNEHGVDKAYNHIQDAQAAQAVEGVK